MSSNNTYYRIHQSLGLLAPIGTSLSNDWLGSSQASKTCYQPKLFHPGDEIHALVGGTFAVTSSGTVHQISPGTPPHLSIKDTGTRNWMPLMLEGLVDQGYIVQRETYTKPIDGYSRSRPVLAEGLPHRIYPKDRILRTIAEDILVDAIENALLPEDGDLPNLVVSCLKETEDHIAVAQATLRDANGEITHRLSFSLSRNLLSARLIDLSGPDFKRLPDYADRIRDMGSMPTRSNLVAASPQAEEFRALVAELGAMPGPKFG